MDLEQLSEVLLPLLLQKLSRVHENWEDELDRKFLVDRLTQYVDPVT